MSEEAPKEPTRAKDRPRRRRIESQRKLAAEPRAGFVSRWFNDYKGGQSIQQALDAGYTFREGRDTPPNGIEVEDAPMQQARSKGRGVVSRDVGLDPYTNQGMRAYLMDLPEEYYQEDRDAEEDELREREYQMTREGRDNPDFYGDIKIQHGRSRPSSQE